MTHPTAACPEANKKYWAWVRAAEAHGMLGWHYKDCQDAKALYQLHLWDCDKCTSLLRKYRNYVKDGLHDKDMPQVREAEVAD